MSVADLQAAGIESVRIVPRGALVLGVTSSAAAELHESCYSSCQVRCQLSGV